MEDFENTEDEDPVMAVVDMDGYVEEIARAVTQELSPGTDHSDLFNYCTKEQIVSIVEENCLGFSENNEPLINSEIFYTIYNSILQRVQNGALSKLAAEGYLECAWDDDLNEMVFWLADESADNA